MKQHPLDFAAIGNHFQGRGLRAESFKETGHKAYGIAERLIRYRRKLACVGMHQVISAQDGAPNGATLDSNRSQANYALVATVSALKRLKLHVEAARRIDVRRQSAGIGGQQLAL